MRRAKQIIYGVFYFIVLAGIFTLFYTWFLKPKPVAPCMDCTVFDIKPMTAGTVSVFNPVAGHATLLVRIANWNTSVGADTFGYAFTAYDASGVALGTVSGNSFAYPNEAKYIVIPNESVSGTVARADFAFDTPHWVGALQTGTPPHFTFKNIVTAPVADYAGALAASGQITNDDDAALRNITVVAIFKDQYGNPAGASQTEIDGLQPQETANFSVSYPTSTNINLSATEVHAYAWR